MTAHSAETSADLLCHQCGYDLRAHPPDGKCPECGASVAESQRLAAIPRRPAWRDSDPRWRRRILAGVWILALMPLMDALHSFGWASHISIATPFDYRGTVSTLNNTLLCSSGVYAPIVFCIGIALLFSKERGRRVAKLDWTRRWGVLCSYVVLLLNIAAILFISALVLASIAAVFQSMPLKYQPRLTQLFVEVSTKYLRYGAYANAIPSAMYVAFSSSVILLASVALFDALRSSGSKRIAMILLAPLALFAFFYLAQAGLYLLTHGGLASTNADYDMFFRPDILIEYIARSRLPWYTPTTATFGTFVVEAIKWCTILAIAIWLSIAQIAASRRTDKCTIGKIP